MPEFSLLQGTGLQQICKQIGCERMALRENSLDDLSAVIAWMNAGASSWKAVDLSRNHFRSLCGGTCETDSRECGRVREQTQQCSSSISSIQRWDQLRKFDLRFNNISGLCSGGAAVLYNLLVSKGSEDAVPLQGNPLHEVKLEHVATEVLMTALNIPTVEKYTCESCDGNNNTAKRFWKCDN